MTNGLYRSVRQPMAGLKKVSHECVTDAGTNRAAGQGDGRSQARDIKSVTLDCQAVRM